MKRWIVTCAALALLLATIVLAFLMVQAQGDARHTSAERLRELKAAAAQEIVAWGAELAGQLETLGPGEPLPHGVARIQTIAAHAATSADPGVPSEAEAPVDLLPVTGTRYYIGLLRNRPKTPRPAAFAVGVRLPNGDLRIARTEDGALIERLAPLPAIGPPPRELMDPESRYTRLLLVDAAGAPIWWVQPPRADGDDSKHGLEHRIRANEVTRRIARGKPDPYVGDSGPKMPVSYKGYKSESTYGVWEALPGVEGLTFVAEMTDDQALGDTLGVRVSVGGEESPPLYGWYATLGLSILLGLVSTFLWLFRHQAPEKVGVLLRTYKFAIPYKWLILATIAMGMLFSFAGIGRIYLAEMLINDVLVDGGPDAEDTLWWIGGAVVVLALLTGLTGYFKIYLKSWTATAMVADVRMQLAQSMLNLSLGFFDRMRAGDLVARIERDVSSLRKVLNQVFERVFVEPFTFIGAVVLAFVVNSTLALVLLGLPIVIYPLFRIAKKVKKRATKRQDLMADLSHVTFQMLMGIKIVKAFGGEDRETERLDTANRRYIVEALKIHRLTALSDALLDFLQMLGAAILMVGGGYLVLGGDVLVGDLVAFLLIVSTIYKSAKEISSVANRFIDAIPGTERVFEIFDEKADVVDGPEHMPKGMPFETIELRNVCFSYQDVQVLHDVNLKVPAGKIVALVGPTGAGKSTLCDLVPRFYDPSSGEILFDGRNVREFTTRSLLDNVAVVTQDAFLFNTTIIDNIRYARPDATREEVEAAARDAFVHDEIVDMEDGYRKIAGERGTNLSGGQRQRVTIARALLKDAPVLILDEATSALDTNAEQQVQAALDRLMAGRTVIVVAHRLSTIRNADIVVVLDGGRVVEQGPPAELLADYRSRFRIMYEAQHGRIDDHDGADNGAVEGDA